jgi:hypothetical protein
MGDSVGKEQKVPPPSLSRRDFLKAAARVTATALLSGLKLEGVPPPPKEQYTDSEWFAIRSLPERAVDSVVTRGFAGISLPVIKRNIAAIEGSRYTKESPLTREFSTYSLTEVRRVLNQLNSSVLFDVTFFIMPQWDSAYVLPVSWQRVDIDPKTGTERLNPEVIQWEKLYIPDEKIQLGRGLLGESWRVETTEELPPDRKLEITWVGKRTPFEIDASGKLIFDPTRNIAFYSELKQDHQGSYYEMFSGVSPTGVLYLPVEMSVTPEPQPMKPRGLEA